MTAQLFTPVEIGGVTVSRASLHNREEVARKDIREGDRVRVQRAGDVIPQVVERIDEPDRERAVPFRMPASCPSCSTPLVERGPFTVCPNGLGCPAQLVGRLVHFAARDALDIEGLGEETARQLVTQGLVRGLPDLFDLRAEQLVELDGFAEKSAQNLVDGIRRAARPEFGRLLYGLGIPEVGEAVARDLARHFRELDPLRAADAGVLQDVPGVGPKMAEQIAAFFAEPHNSQELDRLLEGRVEVLPPSEAAPATAPLSGLRFVFTGGLEAFGRREAKELVEAHGAKVAGGVSKSTSYVVAGGAAGSKLDEARALGVEVLDEAGFLVLLRERGVVLPEAAR